MTRYHDDRTGKQHDRFLGGAVDEEDDQFPGDEEEPEHNDGDLDALATAQEDEAEALVPLATANREHSVMLETNSIRYECHVVIFLSNIQSEIVPPTDQNESASSVTAHTGLHSAVKSKGNQERRMEK